MTRRVLVGLGDAWHHFALLFKLRTHDVTVLARTPVVLIAMRAIALNRAGRCVSPAACCG